jgi:hypothetical protein
VLRSATAPGGIAPAGEIDEDLPHCVGRRAEEVRAALPPGGRAGGELQERLVNQLGGGERRRRIVGGQSLVRETLQLIVDDGHELIERAGLPGAQDLIDTGTGRHLTQDVCPGGGRKLATRREAGSGKSEAR